MSTQDLNYEQREGGADIFLDYFMLLIQEYVCTLPDSYSPVTA